MSVDEIIISSGSCMSSWAMCMVMIVVVGCCSCSPPEDPVKCWSPSNTNCTITNSYGAFPDRSICRVARVVYPFAEEEVVSAVANATLLKSKIKVATRFSHSIPKLVCPDQGGDGLLISTKYLNRVLEVDPSRNTITVESGVTLRQLINAAAKASLALPYAPYWWGLTMGGLMATGAHGSTLWGLGSSVHDYVTQVRIVTPASPQEGYAKVRILQNGDPDLNAARVSLGVLGIITQVTLNLQPMFKRSITYLTKNDTDLGDEATHFGKQHEFADMTWYPSQHKVVYRIDDRVSSNTSGNGLNDFPGFRSTPSLVLAILRASEEGQESKNDVDGKCTFAKLTTATLRSSAYGFTNDGIAFTRYPVVGYQNRVQSSGTCLDSPEDATITACPWDHRVKGLFFHQTTFSIGLLKAQSFIQDVQRLVALEPKALCGLDLYNGILMRYVTASSAYLGKQEDALDFDITYFRSKDPLTPRLHQDILEELEQIAGFKYGALPHWGKNRNLAFVGAINKYKDSAAFLKVKQKFDPLGLFSSEWTDQILGLKAGGLTVDKEGCALEGLCLCSQDIHCAPNKGYFCRPGRIFKEARVCSARSESIDFQKQ